MLTTLLVSLALLIPGSPADSPVAAAPGLASPAGAGQAGEFAALESEFSRELSTYKSRARDARQRGEEFTAPHPAVKSFPALRKLADAGSSEALSWCLDFTRSAGLGKREIKIRRSLVELAAEDHPDAGFIDGLLRHVANEVEPGGVGRDHAARFCRAIHDGAGSEERRRQALLCEGSVLEVKLASTTLLQVSASRALEVYRELIEAYPETREASQAAGRLFRLENLVVGTAVPDFEYVDTRGRQHKLSDQRGEVCVVAFWGFWSPACRRMLPGTQQLVARLAGEPFVWIGVNTDGDRRKYDRQAVRNGVAWRNAWEGSRNGPWVTAWGITSFPWTCVIDGEGVLRHVNIQGKELSDAVDTLLAESRPLGDLGAEASKQVVLSDRFATLKTRFNQGLQTFTMKSRRGDTAVHPAKTLLPEMRVLAEQGFSRAMHWLVTNLTHAGIPRAEVKQQVAFWLDRLVDEHPDDPLLEAIVGDLEITARRVGHDVCFEFLSRLVERTGDDRLRAQCLYQHAWMLESRSPSLATRDEVRALLRTLVEDHPDARRAQVAAQRLAALERVHVGKPLPATEFTDEDGQKFSLESLRGTVVVLSFWDPRARPARRMHVIDSRLLAEHVGDDFSYVSLRTDQSARIPKSAPLGRIGRTVPLGGRSADLCREWGIRQFPTRLVLDREGVLRRIYHGGSLNKLVDELLSDPAGQR